MTSEEWILNGERHRLDGPAYTGYFSSTGRVFFENYYREGKKHRIDGPAMSSYSQTGDEHVDHWYLDGAMMPDENTVYQTIATWAPSRLRYEFERSDYAELLDEGADPVEVAQALSAGVRTLAGLREVLSGAPAEWVVAYEEGNRAS